MIKEFDSVEDIICFYLSFRSDHLKDVAVTILNKYGWSLVTKDYFNENRDGKFWTTSYKDKQTKCFLELYQAGIDISVDTNSGDRIGFKPSQIMLSQHKEIYAVKFTGFNPYKHFSDNTAKFWGSLSENARRRIIDNDNDRDKVPSELILLPEDMKNVDKSILLDTLKDRTDSLYVQYKGDAGQWSLVHKEYKEPKYINAFRFTKFKGQGGVPGFYESITDSAGKQVRDDIYYNKLATINRFYVRPGKDIQDVFELIKNNVENLEIQYCGSDDWIKIGTISQMTNVKNSLKGHGSFEISCENKNKYNFIDSEIQKISGMSDRNISSYLNKKDSGIYFADHDIVFINKLALDNDITIKIGDAIYKPNIKTDLDNCYSLRFRCNDPDDLNFIYQEYIKIYSSVSKDMIKDHGSGSTNNSWLIFDNNDAKKAFAVKIANRKNVFVEVATYDNKSNWLEFKPSQELIDLYCKESKTDLTNLNSFRFRCTDPEDLDFIFQESYKIWPHCNKGNKETVKDHASGTYSAHWFKFFNKNDESEKAKAFAVKIANRKNVTVEVTTQKNPSEWIQFKPSQDLIDLHCKEIKMVNEENDSGENSNFKEVYKMSDKKETSEPMIEISNEESVLDMFKADGIEIAYRSGATASTRLVKKLLIKLLKKRGANDDRIIMVRDFLDSEEGEIAIQAFTGGLLTLAHLYVPQVKGNKKVKRLAKEFRVSSGAGALNLIIETFIEEVGPVFFEMLSKLPELAEDEAPKGKLRVIESKPIHHEETDSPPEKAASARA